MLAFVEELALLADCGELAPCKARRRPAAGGGLSALATP